jgi:GntR family frlABCD operon transcriptional regulator
MKLNINSSNPLYHQLMLAIKEDIQNGKYKAGEQLPTEAELCSLYEVSRITARRAVSELVEDGILSRQQGKGTFVTSAKIKRELIAINGFYDFMKESGQTSLSRIISNTTISASERLSSVLQIPLGDPVLQLKRLLFIENEPYIVQSLYFPLTRFPNLENIVGDSTSTYSILKTHYNVEPQSNEKILNLSHASKEDAMVLKCNYYDTLFELETTAYDLNKVPIHNTVSLYLTNKVTFTISSNSNNSS